MNETLLNSDVIMINQDYKAFPGAPTKLCAGKTQAWVRHLSDGSVAVAVPNLGLMKSSMTICFAELGITGEADVRDIWRKQDLGTVKTSVARDVEVHDTFLVIVKPTSQNQTANAKFD